LPAGEKAREDFHKTYPLKASGEVRLENFNGNVTVSVWDRAEVRVDAVKTARSKQDLEDIRL